MTTENIFVNHTLQRLTAEFGPPSRTTKKVVAWNLRPGLGIALQLDQPSKEQYSLVWLPYPADGDAVPEIAVEYPGEAGRHSNTYPSPGLERGNPALRLRLRSDSELDDTVNYIKAFRASTPLPEVKSAHSENAATPTGVNPSSMPSVNPVSPKREAISRLVQREVWQRDGGKCVECGTREKLCFDHIVPFSRGGSNTVRNIQLLCESCNCSKGNRI